MINEILDSITAHADMMEAKQYQSVDEIKRDMAIGIELAQKYTDALNDILENELPLSDYIPQTR